MNLTNEQKLEMTETIARGCGWNTDLQFDEDFMPSVEMGIPFYIEENGKPEWFNPFTDWNDAMRAADALGVKHRYVYEQNFGNGTTGWFARLATNYGGPERAHECPLTAFCLALYEIAKAKLEED